MRSRFRWTLAVVGLPTVLAGAAQPDSPPSPTVAVPPATKLPAPSPVPSSGSPDPRQLRADVAALAQERADATGTTGERSALAAERARLRAQLAELLQRLADRPPTTGPAPRVAETAPTPRPRFQLDNATRPTDSLRLAQALYREDEINAALQAFRLIDSATLPREDRAFVQYMIACCLRRLGRDAEAAALYREVADAREDEFIAECAVWQIGMIRARREYETQLEQLRARASAR